MASVAEVGTDTERSAGFHLAEKPPTSLSQQTMDALDKMFLNNYSLSDDSDDEEVAALFPKYELKVPELDVLKCLRGVQEEPDPEVEISESYLEELISEANEGMKATGLGFLSNAFDTDDLCKDAVQTTFLTYEFKYPSTQDVIDKARKIDLKSLFDTDEEVIVESSGPLEPEDPLPGTSRSFQQQQSRGEVVTIISSDEEDVIDVDDSEELPDDNLEKGSKDTNEEKEKIDNQEKALSRRVPENGHQSEFQVQTERVPSSFIDKNLEVAEPLKQHHVHTKKKTTIEKKGPEEIKYKNIEENQIKVVLEKVDVEEARRVLAEQGKQRKTEKKSCEDLSLNQQNAQKDSETVTEGESRIQDKNANVDIGHEKSENFNREGELPNENNPRVIDTMKSVQIGDGEDVEENYHTKNEKLKDITVEKVKKRGRKPKCKEVENRQADSESQHAIDRVMVLDIQNQNQNDSTEIGDAEASTEMLVEHLAKDAKPFLRMTRSRLRKRKDVNQKEEVADTENPKNSLKEKLITAKPRQKRKAVKRIQRIPVEDGEVDTECEKSEKVKLEVEIRNGTCVEEITPEPVKHNVPFAKIIESVPSATTSMSVEPAVAEILAESSESMNLTEATIPSERMEPTRAVPSSENLGLTAAARPSEHVEPTPTALSSERNIPTVASLPSERVEPAVAAMPSERVEPAAVAMPSERLEPVVIATPSERVEPAVISVTSERVEPIVVAMPSEKVGSTVAPVPPEYMEPPSVGAYVEIENDEVASEGAERTVAAISTTQNGSGIVEKPAVAEPEGTLKNDQSVEPIEAETPQLAQMKLLSPDAPAVDLNPTVPETLEKSKDPIPCMITGETTASVASERREDFVESEKLAMVSADPNKLMTSAEVSVMSGEPEESAKSEHSATPEHVINSVLSAENKKSEAAEHVVEHVMPADSEMSAEVEKFVQPVEARQHEDMDVPHFEEHNSNGNIEDVSTSTENVKDSQAEKQIATEVEKPDEMQISQNSTRENLVADPTKDAVREQDDEVADNSSNQSGMSHHRYVVETEDITDEDEEIPTTKKLKLDISKAGHPASHETTTAASSSSGIALPVKKRKRVRFSQTLTHTVLFGGDAPLNATNSDKIRRVILKPISILKRRGVPRAVKSFDERHADYAVTSPNSRRMDPRPSTSSSVGLSIQEHYSNTRPALNRRLLNCQAKSTRSFDASSSILVSSRVEQMNAAAPEHPGPRIIALNTIRDNNLPERENRTEITQSQLERPMSSNQDLSTSVPTFASGQSTNKINKTPQTEEKTSQSVGVIVSSSSKPGPPLNSGASTGDVQSYPPTSSCPTSAATPALAQLTISTPRQNTSDKTQTTKEASNDAPLNSTEEHEVVTIDADDIITVKVEVHKQQSCSDGTHQIIQSFQNFQNQIGGQSEAPQEARKAPTLSRGKPSLRKSRPKSDAATSTRDMNPHAIIPSLSPAKTPVSSTPLYYSRYPGVRILKKIPVNPQKPVAKPGQGGWNVGVRPPTSMYSTSDANGQQNASTVAQNHFSKAITSLAMSRSNGGLGIVSTATTPPGHQSRRNSLEALAATPAYQARRNSLETTLNPLHTARRNSMETTKSVAPNGRPRPRLLQPRSKSADVGLHEMIPDFSQSGSSFRSQNNVAEQLPEPTPGPSRGVLHLRGVPTRVITRSMNVQKDSSALLRAMASAMADVTMTSVIRPPPKKNKNLMSLQDYMTAGRQRRLSERPPTSAIDLPPSLLELNSDSFELREVRFADTNISAVYDPGTGLDLLFDCRHEHCSKRFNFTCLQDNLFRRHMIVQHQTEPSDTLFLEHTVRSSRLRECTKCNGIMAYGFETHRESCSPNVPMERAFQLPEGVCEQSVTFRHCGLCDAKYTKRFALMEHIKSEHLFIYSKVLLDPDFRCAHCLFEFNDTADLMQHALACEERPSNDTICDLAKKCLECAICQTNHQNFGETKKCFTDAKVFRCYICCAIFKSTHKFHEHICTYHGFDAKEKTLKCPLCADPEKFKLPDLPQHVLCVHYIPSLKAFMERFRLARRNKAATTTSKTLVANQKTDGSSDSSENKRPFGLSPQALQELSSFEGSSATDSSTTEPSMIIKSVAGNVTNATGTPSFIEKPESNIQTQSVLSINCVSGGTLTVLPVQPDDNQIQLSPPQENPLSSVKISSVRSCSLKAVESIETSPPPKHQSPVQRPQATHPLIVPAEKIEMPGHSTLAKVVATEPTGGAVSSESVAKAVLPSPSVSIPPANISKPLTKPVDAPPPPPPPPPPVTTSSSLFPFPPPPSIQLGSRSTNSPHSNSPRSTVIQLQNGAGSISIFPSASGSGSALPSKHSSPQATITRPPPPGSPLRSSPIRQPQTFLGKPAPTTRPSATISLTPEGLPQLTRFIRPGPYGPNPALRRPPQALNPGGTGRPQQVNLNIPQLPLGTSISRVYPQKGSSTSVSLQNPGIQLK